MTENNIHGLEMIKAEIDAANRIALFCHVNPDGDTLGSGFALYNALKMYGKKPYIFCSSVPSENLRAEIEDTQHFNEVDDFKADLAIAVDAASMDMLGDKDAIFTKAKKHAVIDHHQTNTRYGEINVVDATASAASEVVYELIVLLNKDKPCINENVARLLYLAIVTDSGAFSFDSVTPNTHRVAGELLSYGFDASKIIYNLFKKKKKDVFRLHHRVLDKVKFFDDDKIAIVTFRDDDFKATNTDVTATEGVINNLINIDGVMIAISISEAGNNSYKLSIRTKHPIDASSIAVFFGGGGHARAAGLRMSGFYEDVLDTIVRYATIELGD